MTDATFLSFVRSLLFEPVAKAWTDAEIELYKTAFAIPAVIGRYWYLLAPLKRKRTFLVVTANNPEVPLPDDYYKLMSIRDLTLTTDITPMDEGEEEEYEGLSDGDVRKWMFCGGKLVFKGTPTESSVDRYRIYYMPKLTLLADIPEVLHPLIAIEVIKAAKVKDEDLRADVTAIQAAAEEAATVELSVHQIQEPDKLRGLPDD